MKNYSNYWNSQTFMGRVIVNQSDSTSRSPILVELHLIPNSHVFKCVVSSIAKELQYTETGGQGEKSSID